MKFLGQCLLCCLICEFALCVQLICCGAFAVGPCLRDAYQDFSCLRVSLLCFSLYPLAGSQVLCMCTDTLHEPHGCVGTVFAALQLFATCLLLSLCASLHI